MSTQKIFTKLHKETPQTKRVTLGKVSEILADYKSYYSEHEMAMANIGTLLAQLTETVELILNANTNLEPVYLDAYETWNKAVEIGLEDQIPNEWTDILDLDVAAGLGKVKRNAEALLTTLRALDETDFEYV